MVVMIFELSQILQQKLPEFSSGYILNLVKKLL